MPSIPEQAHEVFTALAEVTALKGRQYNSSSSFGEAVIVTPPNIAVHFPEAEPDSLSIYRTIYLRQILEDGKPIDSGTLGVVSYIQKER